MIALPLAVSHLLMTFSPLLTPRGRASCRQFKNQSTVEVSCVLLKKKNLHFYVTTWRDVLLLANVFWLPIVFKAILVMPYNSPCYRNGLWNGPVNGPTPTCRTANVVYHGIYNTISKLHYKILGIKINQYNISSGTCWLLFFHMRQTMF